MEKFLLVVFTSVVVSKELLDSEDFGGKVLESEPVLIVCSDGDGLVGSTEVVDIGFALVESVWESVSIVDSLDTVVSVVCLSDTRVDESKDVLLVLISVFGSMLADCVIVEVSVVECSGVVVDGAMLVVDV